MFLKRDLENIKMVIKRVYKDKNGDIFDVEIDIKAELKTIIDLGISPDDVLTSVIADTDRVAKEVYDAVPYNELV